jgi:hypothetical protein
MYGHCLQFSDRAQFIWQDDLHDVARFIRDCLDVCCSVDPQGQASDQSYVAGVDVMSLFTSPSYHWLVEVKGGRRVAGCGCARTGDRRHQRGIRAWLSCFVREPVLLGRRRRSTCETY